MLSLSKHEIPARYLLVATLRVYPFTASIDMVALQTGAHPAPIEFLTDREVCSGLSSGMPRIPEMLLDGIAFLYPTKEAAAENKRVGGTAFLVARHGPRASEAIGQNASIPFLVSNRHVVWDAGASVPRFNRRNGAALILDAGPEDWTVHPGGDDLAAISVFGLIDRIQERITSAQFESLLTEQQAKAMDIGIGDDVFMLGRFLNHQGREQTEPAVRFGNISMSPAPIWNKATRRDQISYAVEMRSRTGFSGSPVIVYRTPSTFPLKELPAGSQAGWGILGVNWGYIIDEDGENTWLNGVVPAWKVIELLEEPKLKRQFEEADALAAKHINREDGAELSAAVQEPEPPMMADNPQHREDFNRLLSAAARKQKQDD